MTSLGGLLLISIVTACSKPAAEPPKTPDTDPVVEKYPEKVAERSQLVIGPKIAEACGIQATDTFFDYNSSKVTAQASRVLQAIVDCFITGPLAGRSMRVVGHADPRGDDEYNMALGGRRADGVARYMSELGLSSAKMETSSRGEMDATGTDEASWKNDRKVELFLVD
jgi:peptidoglycan-associated lipoprotein